jgi:hypothetical protein
MYLAKRALGGLGSKANNVIVFVYSDHTFLHTARQTAQNLRKNVSHHIAGILCLQHVDDESREVDGFLTRLSARLPCSGRVFCGVFSESSDQSDKASVPQTRPAVRQNRPCCGWVDLVYQINSEIIMQNDEEWEMIKILPHKRMPLRALQIESLCNSSSACQ